MRYGFRAVTMNDVAKELGISKKTLYQHFNDKEDLVLQTLEKKLAEDKCMAEDITASEKNPVEVLIKIFLQVNKMFEQLKDGILLELQKYYPKGFQKFQEYKKGHVYTLIRTNLEKGQTLGLYRKGVNADILAKYFMQVPDIIINESAFPVDQYEQGKVHKQIVFHFLHGIVTPEGRKLIHAHKKEIGHETL